ncbi:MAG: polyprenol monophosphomannose synthase [Bacteroidales bacterium]|nr:polyprenol monophosphomannose synthase [Bacteroidales bacterium]OQC43566.1 MAG: Undecaprenyl-phosphate mannosyltransferase [Bacteroidetes bacterium ADurb.Bin028]
MKENIVIIPTYNEKENVENIIRYVFNLPEHFNILIVDDGSPDGTGKIVKTLIQEFPDRLFIIERSGKLGLGTAYITGFKWCLKNGYTYIYEMDADFSHNPDDLIRLHKACLDGADMSVGSRYKVGVNVVNWPLKRVLLSYFASKYVRLITRMKFTDTTAGFVCYHRKVLETINLDSIKMIGYAFQIEMKFKAWLHNFKIAEVNIVFTDRQKGQSKMSGSIVGEAIFGVIKMKLQSIFNKKKYLA